MANTFTLISTISVGSGGASSIDFTSIPSTFTDLVVVASLRTNYAALYDNCSFKVNGNAITGGIRIYGSGSAAASDTNGYLFVTTSATNTSNVFSSSSAYFPNYAGSQYKSFSIDSVSEYNGTNSYQFLEAALWSSTAAINQLTLTSLTSSTIVQYSSASLYGILKA